MKNFLILIILITYIVSAQSVNSKFYSTTKLVETHNNVNVKEYSVQSAKEELRYTLTNKTPYDVPYSELKVFKNASSAMINAFYGTIDFYNSVGSKISSITIRKNISIEYERGIRAVISEDKLLIQFAEQNESFSTIQKYSNTGVLEKEIIVEYKNITGVAYSSKIDQIFLSRVVWGENGSHAKLISHLNESGRVINEFSANFSKGVFLDDGKFAAFSKKEFLLIDSKVSELLVNRQVKSGYQILDLTVSQSKIITVSAIPPHLKGGKWFYKNPLIQEFDFSGKVLIEKIVETKEFVEYAIVNSEGVSFLFVDDEKLEM